MSDIYSHSSKSNAISVFIKRKQFVNIFSGKEDPPLKRGDNKDKRTFAKI